MIMIMEQSLPIIASGNQELMVDMINNSQICKTKSGLQYLILNEDYEIEAVIENKAGD
jgi:hypothetical protein